MKLSYGFTCAVIAVWSLVACEARIQPSAESSLAVESASIQSSHTRPSVHAKPGADVRLVNPGPFELAPDLTTSMDLALSTSQDHGVLQVQISADDELSIISGMGPVEFVLHPEGNYTIPLQIHAQTLGRFYIRLQVSLDVDGKIAGRSMVIAVQVGAPAQRDSSEQPSAKQEKVTHSSSAAVISLPALETVSPSE